jgi:hypothetical protein
VTFVVDLFCKLVILRSKQQYLLELFASVQMQHISILTCQTYGPSKSPVFSYLSYLFTQNKLHADGTSWNGCFAVVHLSRFTLQVVPFVLGVFFLHCYFNASSMHFFPVKVQKAMQHPNLIFVDES